MTADERLRASHVKAGGDEPWCADCDEDWPCDTIAALDEARARIDAALALCDEWFADDGVDQYVKRAGREVVDTLAGPVTDTP